MIGPRVTVWGLAVAARAGGSVARSMKRQAARGGRVGTRSRGTGAERRVCMRGSVPLVGRVGKERCGSLSWVSVSVGAAPQESVAGGGMGLSPMAGLVGFPKSVPRVIGKDFQKI